MVPIRRNFLSTTRKRASSSSKCSTKRDWHEHQWPSDLISPPRQKLVIDYSTILRCRVRDSLLQSPRLLSPHPPSLHSSQTRETLEILVKKRRWWRWRWLFTTLVEGPEPLSEWVILGRWTKYFLQNGLGWPTNAVYFRQNPRNTRRWHLCWYKLVAKRVQLSENSQRSETLAFFLDTVDSTNAGHQEITCIKTCQPDAAAQTKILSTARRRAFSSSKCSIKRDWHGHKWASDLTSPGQTLVNQPLTCPKWKDAASETISSNLLASSHHLLFCPLLPNPWNSWLKSWITRWWR